MTSDASGVPVRAESSFKRGKYFLVLEDETEGERGGSGVPRGDEEGSGGYCEGSSGGRGRSEAFSEVE